MHVKFVLQARIDTNYEFLRCISYIGDCAIPRAMQDFIDEKGEVLLDRGLAYSFLIHQQCLGDFGLLDGPQICDNVKRLYAVKQAWDLKRDQAAAQPSSMVDSTAVAPARTSFHYPRS